MQPSRKVVGWAMGEKIDRERVRSALDMALLGRPAPALHHSGRGSQYATGATGASSMLHKPRGPATLAPDAPPPLDLEVPPPDGE